jgi:hypothetical protein
VRKNLLKPAILSVLISLAGVPAAAQVNVNLPGLDIRVGHRAPPPLRHERRGRAPGPGYVWVPGSWDWQANDWAWVPGRWDQPREHARWMKARYQREGEAWRYEPGHWSDERLTESEDYRRWHEEHRHRGDRDRDRDGDRDRDRDQH